MTSQPFISRDSGRFDTGQIRAEVFPLAGLIGFFAGVALVPFLLAFAFADNSVLGIVLSIIGQFILAIGAGIVLMYVIARGIQLSRE